MSYFADFFPLLDEDKIKPKPKAFAVYNVIKKTQNEVALKKLIDTAVKSGSDIFKTPSNKAIDVYRKAGAVLRQSGTIPASKRKKMKSVIEAGKDLKKADSRLVRLVNAASRNQRKKVKGYPITGLVYLGAI